SFRAASSLSQVASTSIVLNVPSGTQANDVMLAQVNTKASGGGFPTITAPAGWTLIRNDQSGTTYQQSLYQRVAGASEPASYTWTLRPAAVASGGVLSFSGVDTPNPVDASNGAASSSNGTAVQAPSVTTTTAN